METHRGPYGPDPMGPDEAVTTRAFDDGYARGLREGRMLRPGPTHMISTAPDGGFHVERLATEREVRRVIEGLDALRVVLERSLGSLGKHRRPRHKRSPDYLDPAYPQAQALKGTSGGAPPNPT